MASLGQGMLLVLTDVAPDDEGEFNRWYDTEHMKERVQVPGFIAARRYRSISGVRRYCAVYETDSIGVFENEDYVRRLGRQTEWSKRVLTRFVDPHRAVGRIGASAGYGFGHALTLLKLPKAASGSDLALAWAESTIKAATEVPGIVAAHLFESVPRLSGPVKEYRPTHRLLMDADDRALLIESSNPAILAEGHLSAFTGSFPGVEYLGVYALTWGLTKLDVE